KEGGGAPVRKRTNKINAIKAQWSPYPQNPLTRKIPPQSGGLRCRRLIEPRCATNRDAPLESQTCTASRRSGPWADVRLGSKSALDNKIDAAFGHAGVCGTALSDHDLPQLPRIHPVLDEFIGHDL